MLATMHQATNPGDQALIKQSKMPYVHSELILDAKCVANLKDTRKRKIVLRFISANPLGVY
jgi:hypothetical protein